MNVPRTCLTTVDDDTLSCFETPRHHFATHNCVVSRCGLSGGGRPGNRPRRAGLPHFTHSSTANIPTSLPDRVWTLSRSPNRLSPLLLGLLVLLQPGQTKHRLDAYTPNENHLPLPACFYLVMFSVTGNRCKHVGYDDFDPPSWNSECAPTTDAWVDTGMSICGVGQSYPEEFWGCSDIAITSGEKYVDRAE